MNKNRKSQLSLYGFTLLELMLVIVIITVMMIAAVKTMQEKVIEMRVQRAVQDIQTIMSAAQDYFVQNGVWPGSGMPLTSNPSGPKASDNANTDLIDAGYLAKVGKSPWGTPYTICPQIADNTNASPGLISCPPALPFPEDQGNISFFVYFDLPPSLSATAAEVAALIPNGVNSCVFSKSKNCQIQAQVVGPSEVLSMANYLQYATVIEPQCYGAQYQPLAAKSVATLKAVTGITTSWPPPMPGAAPQVLAPPAKDCPNHWIPQIYAMPAGFASSAEVPDYTDPSTGGETLPSLSGFFVTPVPRYQAAAGNVAESIWGWDIYATAIQNGGGTSVCHNGAMVAVFIKCTPPSMTSTVIPIVPPTKSP